MKAIRLLSILLVCMIPALTSGIAAAAHVTTSRASSRAVGRQGTLSGSTIVVPGHATTAALIHRAYHFVHVDNYVATISGSITSALSPNDVLQVRLVVARYNALPLNERAEGTFLRE